MLYWYKKEGFGVEKGYEITIVGTSTVKKVIFKKEKPDASLLENLIEEYHGKEAFVKPAEVFTSKV